MTPYYDREGMRIFHGDCRDVLPALATGSIDLVFTSPPYNLGNTTGGGVRGLGHYRKTDGMQSRGGKGLRRWRHPAIANGYGAFSDSLSHAAYVAQQQAVLLLLWDLLTPTGAIYYNHKPRILGGRVITPLAYLPPALLPQVRQIVIWKRSGGINFTQAFYVPMHEWIVIIARDGFRLRDKAASGVGDVWTVHQERNSAHPAPFPLGLPVRAIETTRAGLILDPYMGSGTTLRAAKDCGRRAIGIDLSAAYCDMAIARLAQETMALGATA